MINSISHIIFFIMLSITAKFFCACIASMFIEYRKHRKDKKNHHSKVVRYLQFRQADRKCSVQDYLQVEEYVGKYYQGQLLINYITTFENRKKEAVDMYDLILFVKNPKKMSKKIGINVQ